MHEVMAKEDAERPERVYDEEELRTLDREVEALLAELRGTIEPDMQSELRALAREWDLASDAFLSASTDLDRSIALARKQAFKQEITEWSARRPAAGRQKASKNE